MGDACEHQDRRPVRLRSGEGDVGVPAVADDPGRADAAGPEQGPHRRMWLSGDLRGDTGGGLDRGDTGPAPGKKAVGGGKGGIGVRGYESGPETDRVGGPGQPVISEVPVEPDQESRRRSGLVCHRDAGVFQGGVNALPAEDHDRPTVIAEKADRGLGGGDDCLGRHLDTGHREQLAAYRSWRPGAVVGGEPGVDTGCGQTSQRFVGSRDQPLPAVHHPIDVADHVHRAA